MPGGDRTGPMGQGPATGRGAGYCTGYAVPGYNNRGFGGGRGRGFAGVGFAGGGMRRGRGFGGRGMGAGYNMPVQPVPEVAPPMSDPIQERAILKEQADYLQSALADVKKRLDALTESPAGE